MGVQSCGFQGFCHIFILLFLCDGRSVRHFCPHEYKKPRRKPSGSCKHSAEGNRQRNTADQSPDRVSLLHKGDESIMTQRVRMPHRGPKSFVCHTTPHSDSTSRRVPTLFRSYCTTFIDKCKQKFFNFLAKASPSGDYGSFDSLRSLRMTYLSFRVSEAHRGIRSPSGYYGSFGSAALRSG